MSVADLKTTMKSDENGTRDTLVPRSNSPRGPAIERLDYVFVDRQEEQRRLERPAELFDPLTERVFQAAGLRQGMRVLDLGSGAGDVAMLAAGLVGSDGAVVGIERDPAAVVAATARVERAGISNARVAAPNEIGGEPALTRFRVKLVARCRTERIFKCSGRCGVRDPCAEARPTP